MGFHHTIVWVAAVLALTCGAAQTGFADDAQSASADHFTNRDLLEHSERDRQLWLSAMALGLASGISMNDSDAGACLSRWYFTDEAQSYANVIANMERFPDYQPTVIVIALARRECPGIEMPDR